MLLALNHHTKTIIAFSSAQEKKKNLFLLAVWTAVDATSIAQSSFSWNVSTAKMCARAAKIL